MKLIPCGLLSFEEARKIQERLVKERQEHLIPDTVLLLEHSPVISFGLRSDFSNFDSLQQTWAQRGVSVVRADRGGGVTFHSPGQLVLYPVVSLRERGLGVREFVRLGLTGLAQGVLQLGVPAEARLGEAGVWVRGSRRKLGAAGLRIEHGISKHGFSLNLCPDLELFAGLEFCGLGDASPTSIYKEKGLEIGAQSPSLEGYLRPEYEILVTNFLRALR